jgi:hypothetical protein
MATQKRELQRRVLRRAVMASKLKWRRGIAAVFLGVDD